MLNLLWLLLPVAAASGWYVARREYLKRSESERASSISSAEYVKGLNYLLNEQSDKAIDVFVKMLDPDHDVVEMHLAVGSLFRKRGEVERAIRIHQNLIARQGVSESVKRQALVELARDYHRAGLLDRTEDLCLELIDGDEGDLVALEMLREIYEQEKEWFRAIEIGRRIQKVSGSAMSPVIAHYYCELAEEAMAKEDHPQARRMLDKGFSEDPACGRGAILLGRLESAEGNHQAALAAYRRLEQSAPRYLPEVYGEIVRCFEALGWRKRLLPYLHELLERHFSVELLLVLTEVTKAQKGVTQALALLAEQLERHPSLRGIDLLFSLEAQHRSHRKRRHTDIAQRALARLLENKPVYRCSNCGFTGVVLHWHCPGCRQWATISAIQEFQWGASI